MYKILAVDDRKIFLVELKRLKLWGEKSKFEIVDIALNGKEALELLNKNSYDLVLTDIRMPIIDGLQLLREIKRDNLCPCVVFLSEYSEFNYARQGIILGAFDYIVKPASEETMFQLLQRTKVYLDNIYSDKDNLLGDTMQLIEVDSEWIYPTSDEKQIINYLIKKEDNAIELFNKTAESIYNVSSDNIIKADIIIKKIYHNVIKAVYEEYSWLNNYINIEFFETVDYVNKENINGFTEYYCEKISYLLTFLKKFYLEASDELINNISEYILSHSDSDLKLKIISKKFYINNTYLSNTFAIKTGMRFNDYITMVKMARARYLFINTQLRTYEIGYKIGYRDINYFSKLFKKYYGKNPSEYKNAVSRYNS